MATLAPNSKIKYKWLQKEINLPKVISRGSKHKIVKPIQEWLCYHGFKTGVDQDFGPATQKLVKKFQEASQLPVTGNVDKATFQALITPLLEVLTPIADEFQSFGEAVKAYSIKHLDLHPVEIGGQNMGPWVRLYMQGYEGKDFPWCAGFVSFVMRQVADFTDFAKPLKGSWSCDSLAAQGREAGIFVSEQDIQNEKISSDDLDPVSIFLCRRSSTDWTHTGFAINFDEEVFDTIEGNTNDEGYREGYEACQRVRAYKKKDFLKLV